MSQRALQAAETASAKQEEELKGLQCGCASAGGEVKVERNSGSRLCDLVQGFGLFPKGYWKAWKGCKQRGDLIRFSFENH